MPRGLIAIVLHAHLPYVRHLEQPDPVEERWLYEAITDTYLPLVDVLLGHVDDGVSARLALSLSPTLTTMLRDPLLIERYERYLDELRLLASRQAERLAGSSFEPAIRFYERRLGRVAELWDALEGDLVSGLTALEDAGVVELLTSAATHGYLPLLGPTPGAVEAQVAVGLEQHRVATGRAPAGFWLPECGYTPELDEVLAGHGVAYVVLETHGLEHGVPSPEAGVHAPVACPGGVAAFARDPECSTQVWSATEGYPAHPDYREFYRDLGDELREDELGGLRPPSGVGPLPTGLKLCRITGPTEHKEPYDPAAATARALAHAAHFVQARQRQIRALAPSMDRPPVIVAPFDAELFGHWWFEGPLFLDAVVRGVASAPDEAQLATPSDILEHWPTAQLSSPSASSWGDGGYSEVWLCEDNAWAHGHIHGVGRRLVEACRAASRAEGLLRRTLDQAVRELLLAQASDWTFLIRTGSARPYAEDRLRRHLGNALALLDAVESGEIDEGMVSTLERESPIFPWIDFRLFGVVERGEEGARCTQEC